MMILVESKTWQQADIVKLLGEEISEADHFTSVSEQNQQQCLGRNGKYCATDKRWNCSVNTECFMVHWSNFARKRVEEKTKYIVLQLIYIGI